MAVMEKTAADFTDSLAVVFSCPFCPFGRSLAAWKYGIISDDNLLAMAKEKASVRANVRYSAAYLTGRSVAACGLRRCALRNEFLRRILFA